ncbi:MAG: hypothetical protein ABSE47_05985 [Acidimicrobiales bacterium]|jgi:hypothetical protein
MSRPVSLLASAHPSALIAGIVLAAAVVLLIVRVLMFRRRGYAGDTTHRIVRCSKGHVFTTVWLPGASLTAVRLGGARYQRCPVGKHWSFVQPVKEGDLTDEERRSAEEHRGRLP